jgi:hypothetical protein
MQQRIVWMSVGTAVAAAAAAADTEPGAETGAVVAESHGQASQAWSIETATAR